MKKRIIQGDVEMFYCPGCRKYHLQEEMSSDKNRAYGVGTYCREHWKKGTREDSKWQKGKYKHYYKNQINRMKKSTIVIVRRYGVTKNWGKPRFEKRSYVE